MRNRGLVVEIGAAVAVSVLLLGGAACSSMNGAVADASNPGAGGTMNIAVDAAPSRGSRVTQNGYVTAGSWAGYGFTATDPGAATIVPDCSGAAGCVPPFVADDFCMSGRVTGRADYTGFAMLGWNVNQPQTTGAVAGTWAVPDTGGITVTVLDTPPSVALRVQLQGTNPHVSTDRWCAPLVSGQMIPWTDFRTECWQTGGAALTPGTPIQQGSIIVPGLLTDLPFDVCLIDIQM
jgi:hypothetical protein